MTTTTTPDPARLEYLAISAFGFQYSDDIIEALTSPALLPPSKPRKGSKQEEVFRKSINLWLVDERCAGTDFFRPVDADGNPCGVLLTVKNSAIPAAYAEKLFNLFK